MLASASAFSQPASESVQQKVSIKLMDITMVEKATSSTGSEVIAPPQVRSGSKWLVQAKEVDDDTSDKELNNNYIKYYNNTPVADTTIYTVSKY